MKPDERNASQPTPEQCIQKLENIAREKDYYDPEAAQLARGYARVLGKLTPKPDSSS